MQSAPIPKNEAERLFHLRSLNILDTLEEQAYDDITKIAAHICQTPLALVSLVDVDRQWFKSHYGIDAHETPRDVAFCAHAILSDQLFVVENADDDPRFADNPLVTGQPHVKFYAGTPLVYQTNIHLGTLCVIDHHARTLNPQQREALAALGRQVVGLLQLRMRISELKKLDEAKDAFISMVSHELRTPLTSINASLGLLKHEVSTNSGEDITHLVDIAVRNSSALVNLVNDILDIAKLETGNISLNKQPTDLIGLVKGSLVVNQPYFHSCGCTDKFESREKELIVEVDDFRVQQIMNNLLSNAAKFAYEGSNVLVKVERLGEYARVSVTNNGEGIPADKTSMVFQKFSQINASENQKVPGTGLGLNICKRIVELHNGRIGFESKLKQTTTFYFDLPL